MVRSNRDGMKNVIAVPGQTTLTPGARIKNRIAQVYVTE